MPQAKKFGAFAGVFTPSILTILGVIMYMRLGWVVGHAGLIAAVVMIVVAHIISFSTGLSISSIATDKKIQTGGIYYILSRSLGLPMGGAIGLTLTVGTALSIALYIVGFTESFLAIDSIREFLGLGTSINDFRIVGTVVIILLVIIAFISTSLAIKTQFLILGAIVLSLISIAVGFFMNNEATEIGREAMMPFADGVSLEVLFAVFFPAVTGFTAGVAMSGDLKDPRKDIPVGTMAAILVGLVVYVALAIGFGLFVDRGLLTEDTNFLLKISWIPFLVVAGIWGATLSSALGGILGAPRIFQAISRDRITPYIFSKGHGTNNEPRNALILIFLIAEGGILIGDLNVIAEIVSMFYLASYGFINLSFSLESWASSDFRPNFKIPRFVGWIGFLACFIVMFQIDMLSMFVALIIIGGVYFYLKRRDLQLDFGDVWQSVYSTVVRKALYKIESGSIEKRNWRPNIILFSGGSQTRPYLIQLGKSLLGRHGLLSNFDLIENPTAKVLFPKHEQSMVSEEDKYEGVFTRKQGCRDIYEGIETIAGTYGFSGVEPNTVLMGWARQTTNPKRFGQMLNTLQDLDMSVLMVDYDEDRGFGNRKQIDLWWRGAGNNGNMSLTLIRFLQESIDWRDAHVRLLVINPKNEEADDIREKTSRILESFRVKAEIRIINNRIENAPFDKIIQRESNRSDLVILGIPDIKEGQEEDFISRINGLTGNIGSVILVKASTYFRDLYIVKKEPEFPKAEIAQTDDLEEIKLKVDFPSDPVLAEHVSNLNRKVVSSIDNLYSTPLTNIAGLNTQLLKDIDQLIGSNFKRLIIEFKQTNNNLSKEGMIVKYHQNILSNLRSLISEFHDEKVQLQFEQLKQGIEKLIFEISSLLEEIPHTIIHKKSIKILRTRKTDSNSLKAFKRQKRIRSILSLRFRKYAYHVKLRSVIQHSVIDRHYSYLNHILTKYGELQLKFSIDIQKMIQKIHENLLLIEQNIDQLELDQLQKQNDELATTIQLKTKQIDHSFAHLYQRFILDYTMLVKVSSNVLNHIHPNGFIHRLSAGNTKKDKQKTHRISELWFNNQVSLIHNISVELGLLTFEYQAENILNRISIQIEKDYKRIILEPLQALKSSFDDEKELNEIIGSKEIETFKQVQIEDVKRIPEFFENSLRKLEYTIKKFPETIQVLSEDSYNNYLAVQFDDVKIIKLYASRILDHILQNYFVEPLGQIIQELPDQLSRAHIIANDIVRLTEYSSRYKGDKDKGSNGLNQDSDTIEQLRHKIEDELNKYVSQSDEYLLDLSNIRVSLQNQLSLHSFIQKGSDVKRYFKESEQLKRATMLHKARSNVKSGMKKRINQLWYKQSWSILFAREVIEDRVNNMVSKDRFSEIIQSMVPNHDKLKEVPGYYKQLFIKKQLHYNDLWHGRSDLIDRFGKAFIKHQLGHHGGVIITGQPGSGKSFLGHYLASKFFEVNNTFFIQPIYSGTINLDLFEQTVQNEFDSKASVDDIFKDLPQNSLVIFDDIELWWEKSEQGFVVINKLFDLIRNYKHKCMFVFVLNQYALNLFRKIYDFESLIIDVMECKPFPAASLQEIILSRHDTSGLELMNAAGIKLSAFGQARYFTRLFNKSRGNVNAALLAYMASIQKVDDGKVYISKSPLADTSVFERMSPLWNLVVLQFLLHKHLDVDRLARILSMDKLKVKNELLAIRRCGLIEEIKEDVFRINPYINIHLQQALINIDLL